MRLVFSCFEHKKQLCGEQLIVYIRRHHLQIPPIVIDDAYGLEQAVRGEQYVHFTLSHCFGLAFEQAD